ncbi:MAG: chain length-determining protein, partial [Sphingobacteriales bacterium]
MDKVYLKELISALRSELIRFRFLFVAAFIAISFLILVVGMVIPKKYITTVSLVADITNIIEPLLKGNAEVTKIDRSEQAQQFIHTRGVIEVAAKQRGLIKNEMSADEQDRIIKRIRSNLIITPDKNNVFRLSYSSNDPDGSFEMLNTIVNVFLAGTEKRKREESLGAYNFIDAQVQSYKHQLE